MSYIYETTDIENIAGVLNQASVHNGILYDFWVNTQESPTSHQIPAHLRREIDMLFVYELQEEFDGRGRVILGQSDYSVTATRSLKETPAEVWAMWSEVTALLSSDLLVAHIRDCLLTSDYDPTPSNAEHVVQRYLQVASNPESDTSQSILCLARANHITRSRSMELEEDVRKSMYEYLATLIAEGKFLASALTVLNALAIPGTYSQLVEDKRMLQGYLYKIGERSIDVVHEVSSVLQRLAENEEEVISVQCWHVNRVLEYAGHLEPKFRRIYLYNEAIELAEKYQLSELRDEAVKLLQSSALDQEDWDTLDSTVIISRNYFRAYLNKYRFARNWEHALLIFLSGDAPSGNHERNKVESERVTKGSIRRYFANTVFGSHGLPEKSNIDFDVAELDRYEMYVVQNSAVFLAVELEHIEARFRPESEQQLSAWMQSHFSVDSEITSLFSRVLFTHWDKRYSDASRLAIPLIEKGCRELLLSLNEALYVREKGQSPGRFPAMGFYLEALESAGFDIDWIRSLRVTLLDNGMNWRNREAHGFLFEFSSAESALLVRLAGLFAAMPMSGDDTKIQNPLANIRRRLKRRLGWVWR